MKKLHTMMMPCLTDESDLDECHVDIKCVEIRTNDVRSNEIRKFGMKSNKLAQVLQGVLLNGARESNCCRGLAVSQSKQFIVIVRAVERVSSVRVRCVSASNVVAWDFTERAA